MVVDSYSARLLGALGYEFESYDELSAWLGELEFERIYEFVNSANFPCDAAAKADKLENENGAYALGFSYFILVLNFLHYMFFG